MNINYYNPYVREELMLYHHGVLGQRWGKQNGPPYPLAAGAHSASEKKAGWKKSLAGGDSSAKSHSIPLLNKDPVINEIKNSKHYTRNLDDFGKDADHNVLFITGLSGSGKSTLTQKFKNDNKIHLDYYFEKGDPKEDAKYQDREFNDFMDKNGIEFRKIKALKNSDPNKWKIVDQMGDAIVDFSKQQYRKGKKVVAEGVELANEAMYPDKHFFDKKSLVVLETPAMLSLKRGLERDGISPFDVACVAERIKYQRNWKKQLKDLKNLDKAERKMNKLLKSK